MRTENERTIFDEKKIDLIAFATQMFDFYDGVEQHMENLRNDIEELQNKIDYLCSQIHERVNARKPFLELSEQINEIHPTMKAKFIELKKLSYMTDGCNCKGIAEDLWCAIEQMESYEKDN